MFQESSNLYSWSSVIKSTNFLTKVNLYVGHLDRQGGELQIRVVATFEPKCSIPIEDGHSKSRLGGDSSPASARLESLKARSLGQEAG